jgi:hypothetical protein
LGEWRGESQVTPPRRPLRSCVAPVSSERGSRSLRGGVAWLSCRQPRKALAVLLLLGAVAGCGQSDGVASGTSVGVYVAGSLCAEAKRELARSGSEAGDVRIRVTCLPGAESSQGLDLAQIGANARRASEDSSSIAYIGEPTRAASRFSEPILETAGIAQLPQTSGTAAMKKLIQAVNEAGNSSSLRESVNAALE